MKKQQQEVPHIVETYKIGNTIIHVADNYCRDKTPEDVQKILDRLSERMFGYLADQEAKEKAAQG